MIEQRLQKVFEKLRLLAVNFGLYDNYEFLLEDHVVNKLFHSSLGKNFNPKIIKLIVYDKEVYLTNSPYAKVEKFA